MAHLSNRNLTPAHRGYIYQDLLSAQALALLLVEQWEEVVVDKKIVQNDKFDDLQINTGKRIIRRQIKHTSNSNKRFKVGDIRNKSSTLRIDELFETYVLSGQSKADEYRVCANWGPPDNDFDSLLIPVSGVPSVYATDKSYIYQIDASEIWSRRNQKRWSCLDNIGNQKKEFFEFLEVLTLEFGLPSASFNLHDPGPLESVFLNLIEDRVGIGSYPNQNRSPVDVAGLLISVAARARANSETIQADELEFQLNLRTDFGRISQEFPLDRQSLQERSLFEKELAKEAYSGKRIAIVGAPGSGKSCELTKLAEQLRESEILVCRHYCYLEPGDEDVEHRILVNSVFANLIAELIDHEPALRSKLSRRYSAGLSEFEELLSHTADLDRPVVVIVDGLDHIARVLRESQGVSAHETDIIDQISSIRLPDNVTLIIGSQPGAHLDPLRTSRGSLKELPVPDWTEEEVAGLATALGVERSFHLVEYQCDVPAVMKAIHIRSEGNPLYATYLCKQLVNGISQGSIVDAYDWLDGAPEIHGNIANYYDYLYLYASKTTKSVADVMGVIDFGVTRDELWEILPGPMKGWVDAALADLDPILRSVAMQGGLRIYHESFRRFMISRIRSDGRQISEVLEPVVDWLAKKGLMQDAKASRFLLPCLFRAGRFHDLLVLVPPDFVSECVSNGHPYVAVLRNLAIAAEAAAAIGSFSDLVRIAELHRSAHTCFEDKLNDPSLYWQTFIALFGSESASRRLLFDGQPTQSKYVGLDTCSLVEDAGVVAPWDEYLVLEDEEVDDSWGGDEAHDSENRSLARLHGKLCTKNSAATLDHIRQFLLDHSGEASPSYLNKLMSRIATSCGYEALEEFLKVLIQETNSEGRDIGAAIFSAGITLANLDAENGRTDAASVHAKRALGFAANSTDAAMCVKLGAPIGLAKPYLRDPSTFDITAQSIGEGATALREWSAAITLHVGNKIDLVEDEYDRIAGEGWYRCWLRFLIDLAKAEHYTRQGNVIDAPSDVLLPLTEDIRPFAGSPRPCDLYFARGLISESIERCFSLFRTADDWEKGLALIEKVHEGTGSQLDRSASGPFATGMLLSLCQGCADRREASDSIVKFANRLIETEQQSGTYFESHAEDEMILVQILISSGQVDLAKKIWFEIGTYLGGYGYRKDITIFELIESIPSFGRSHPSDGISALIKIQPLVNAVIRHTDGRSTNRAANAWFRSLLKCDYKKALVLLARSMRVRDATDSWVIEDAIGDALESASVDVNAKLVEGLYSSMPFDVDYEGESSRLARVRLEVVENLLSSDRKAGEIALNRLAAQVCGDKRRYVEGAIEVLVEFSKKHGIELPDIEVHDDSESRSSTSGVSVGSDELQKNRADASKILDHPYFEPGSNAVGLISGIRRACSSGRLTQNEVDRFVNMLGYRLVELTEIEGVDSTTRILHFFAQEADFMSLRNSDPLSQIAKGLLRHGYNDLAAAAFTLSFVKGRGGGGWYSIGGKDHEPAILEARDLDREGSEKLLLTELARMLRQPFYNAGISKSIVGRLAAWGDIDQAKAAWSEIYDVVKHRLPTKTAALGVLEPLGEQEFPNWTHDEAIVGLILARINHPECWKKFASICALSDSIASVPNDSGKPIAEFLLVDAATTSIILIFVTMLRSESKPYILSRSLEKVLSQYASSGDWITMALAKVLLQRAGISAPPSRLLPPRKHQKIELEHQLETYLSIDRGDRIQELGTYFPSFPRRVAEVFFRIFEASDIHKERMSERYELSVGQDGKTRPETPVLRWEQEIFETAVSEAVSELYEQAWKSGDWSPSFDTELLPLLLPALDVYVGFFRNRRTRPGLPLPIERRPEEGELEVVTDDPGFAGWIRLAGIERQWIKPKEHGYGQPDREITVLSGAIAVEIGKDASRIEFPFRSGSWTNWIYEEGRQFRSAAVPMGPLIVLERVIDWLGDEFLLAPPLEWLALFGLKPNQELGALSWSDSSGNVALCLRSWRMRDKHAIWADPLEFKGSDLLMRTDMFSMIAARVGGSIVRKTIVWDRSIGEENSG